jgi:UDP-GlcNAc:undecaprenyl-phosphate/decaprenyl-phosphate GlcNAc-1-phosphate transferase
MYSSEGGVVVNNLSLSWMVGLGLFSGLVVYTIVPYVKGVASRNGLLDIPGIRKKHKCPTPECGGIAIFVGILPVMLGLLILALLQDSPIFKNIPRIASLLCACTWILILGVLDDKKRLTWSTKLVGQILAVAFLVLGGHSVVSANIPLIGPVIFGWWGIPLFAVLIVGIINAVNLIDGIDGVAVGICLFAGLAGAAMGVMTGDPISAALQFSLAGALLGFLPYNWPPAKVFLGDGGSMMLGLLLGTMATSSAFAAFPGQRSATFAALVAPFLPFSIALLDVGLAIVRRWVRGRRIYLPDTDHLHHRLATEFKSPERVLFVVYSFSAVFATLSVLIGMRVYFIGSYVGVGIMAASFMLLGVVILRAYRIDHFRRVSRALSERPHFRFLGLYGDFNRAKLSRSRSVDEVVSLLESGVRDLKFDSVLLFHHGTRIKRWDNADRVHPDSERSVLLKEMSAIGISVKAVLPQHERSSFQESLESTWMEFLTDLEARLVEFSSSNGKAFSLELNALYRSPLLGKDVKAGILAGGRTVG